MKQEIYGKQPVEALSEKDVNFLIGLTRDVIELIKRETQMVDFWESSFKQKRLKSYIISHLLKSVPASPAPSKEGDKVKETPASYSSGASNVVFGKRNEIAQKLIELAYHIYGE